MKQHLVEINYQEHKHFALLAKSSNQLAKNLNIIPVTYSEIANVINQYPLVFIKSTITGQFNLFALCGFEAGENLYCQYNLWHENFCPHYLSSKPFYIGYPSEQSNKRVLCVDINSPLIIKKFKASTVGQAFFDDNKQESVCLIKAKDSLARLEQSAKSQAEFIDCVTQLNLIQPLTLDIVWDNGEKKSISGLYTIDPSYVDALTADKFEQLKAHNYLPVISDLNKSLNHIQQLVTLKNKQLLAQVS